MPADQQLLREASEIVGRIESSGLTIYDPLTDRPDLFVPTPALQAWLRAKLRGLSLDYPLRTRSKVLKSAVCKALGYPVPASFKKCRPRFPGQNFDTYGQKANNLQIWNEEVAPERRYVVLSVDEHNRVHGVRVATGTEVAALDSTGTLTAKYQARLRTACDGNVLDSAGDTAHFESLRRGEFAVPSREGVVELDCGRLLPIRDVFDRLCRLMGRAFPNPGLDQDRNRGAVLHALVQRALGYDGYDDNGQFPDVPDQLLEIKLQTSPTIDLGLVSPDDKDIIARIPQARHCDVRYAVIYASLRDGQIHLDHLVLTTGARFFEHFVRFGGLTQNKKRQLRLPDDFFDA